MRLDYHARIACRWIDAAAASSRNSTVEVPASTRRRAVTCTKPIGEEVTAGQGEVRAATQNDLIRRHARQANQTWLRNREPTPFVTEFGQRLSIAEPENAGEN
ncbi:hypothetical protein [Streptomyces wuyuanensis]|uniref:hypothetical protein n=1 Tax=Streptomyces wuyuanensis TaxID=1196353 RepID=UPI00371FF968